MQFNPDSLKQARETVFSWMNGATNYGKISLNNIIINRENVLKHLRLLLDIRLNFVEHINVQIKTENKGISVIRKLHLSLPRVSLLTIYESFVRPHVDYGDVIYDQLNNSTLSDKIESVQSNAALATTSAIRGTSTEKELGLESLQNRRCLRRLCYFHKILSTKLPPYIFDLTPPPQRSHIIQVALKHFNVEQHFFKIRFYLIL